MGFTHVQIDHQPHSLVCAFRSLASSIYRSEDSWSCNFRARIASNCTRQEAEKVCFLSYRYIPNQNSSFMQGYHETEVLFLLIFTPSMHCSHLCLCIRDAMSPSYFLSRLLSIWYCGWSRHCLGCCCWLFCLNTQRLAAKPGTMPPVTCVSHAVLVSGVTQAHIRRAQTASRESMVLSTSHTKQMLQSASTALLVSTCCHRGQAKCLMWIASDVRQVGPPMVWQECLEQTMIVLAAFAQLAAIPSVRGPRTAQNAPQAGTWARPSLLGSLVRGLHNSPGWPTLSFA
jgi:hypothetical protein